MRWGILAIFQDEVIRMSVEGPIKLRPEHWGPPGVVPMYYVSPDGAFWNVGRIVGSYVQLWTVDAWGTVKPDCIREAEFREKWSAKEF